MVWAKVEDFLKGKKPTRSNVKPSSSGSFYKVCSSSVPSLQPTFLHSFRFLSLSLSLPREVVAHRQERIRPHPVPNPRSAPTPRLPTSRHSAPPNQSRWVPFRSGSSRPKKAARVDPHERTVAHICKIIKSDPSLLGFTDKSSGLKTKNGELKEVWWPSFILMPENDSTWSENQEFDDAPSSCPCPGGLSGQPQEGRFRISGRNGVLW